MSDELKLMKAEPLPVALHHEPSVGEMLRAAIQAGTSPKELCDLYERMEAKKAEREFNAAFVGLQADMPVIVASSVIPNRGKYERFEDVMRQIGPFLLKHGFAVSFSQDFKDNRIVVTCDLRHIGGHMRSNSYAVRVSGKSDSETQADCKASTTAKRNALLQALNIVIRQDCLSDENDPRFEGGTVTAAQAEELARRVQLTNSDRTAFLRFAGADSFDKIPANKYETLDGFLSKKERAGR